MITIGIRCEDHDYLLKPDGCPLCRALKAEAELESLRQENSRLRADIGNLQVVNRTANEHIGHEADEHDRLVASLNAELKRLREALEAIKAYDGPGLDGSPGGSCYSMARAALNPPKS